MEESGEPRQFLEALSRWRESCILYFKFDLLLITAIAAMVSFFKFDEYQIIRAASQYKVALHYLIGLLIYALVFELNITSMSNRRNLALILNSERKRSWMYRAFRWAYGLQVLAHALLLFLALGYAAGFVEGFMKCSLGNLGCGT